MVGGCSGIDIYPHAFVIPHETRQLLLMKTKVYFNNLHFKQKCNIAMYESRTKEHQKRRGNSHRIPISSLWLWFEPTSQIQELMQNAERFDGHRLTIDDADDAADDDDDVDDDDDDDDVLVDHRSRR